MMREKFTTAIVGVLVATVMILLYREMSAGGYNHVHQDVVQVVQTGGSAQVRTDVGLAADTDVTKMNAATVQQKYPGIKLIDVKEVDFYSLTAAQAEDQFYKFSEKLQVECKDIKRMGSGGDGGWDMCISEPYAPKKSSCIVYSIGTGSDWSFDDHMSGVYGCEVFGYDPTVRKPPYKTPKLVKWFSIGLHSFDGKYERGPVRKLSTLFKENGHTDKTIDYLKIDIEGAEWPAFEMMLKEGALRNVKQFSFEFHTPEAVYFGKKLGTVKKEDFIRYAKIMADIEKAGFKRYLIHINAAGNYKSTLTGKTRSCCWEVYYINLNYVKK